MGRKLLIQVAGPTASGKTALAIDLAKKYNTVVLNADSRQFFQEMLIGTARPTEEEQQGITHYFTGHISIHDTMNVALYEAQALALLQTLFERHDVVVMCGGSGLYLDAVRDGLDELPAADPQVRDSLNSALSQHGLSHLFEELKKSDPEYADRVDPKNPRRILRALEVIRTTGKRYSELRKGATAERSFQTLRTAIHLDREVLYERINQRTEKMMQNGLLEEASTLLPYRHLNALQTVGYRELFAYMDGEISLDEAVALIKQHTRNYARRQLTWFRRDQSIRWVEPGILPQFPPHN